MRVSQSMFLCMLLLLFSTSALAEYYFGSDQNTCRRHYKDEQHYSDRRHTGNYNLDLITGDDDPYVYPGMNINN